MSIESPPADLPDDKTTGPVPTDLLGGELAGYWLSSIIESADDAIISKTLEGRITSWNKGAERIFGYTAEEAVGQSVTILIPEDHLDEEPGILARLRAGERIEHYETVRMRKDGTLVDISLTVSPIRGPDDKVIGASKIARDITERKRAERELREAREQLEGLLGQEGQMRMAAEAAESRAKLLAEASTLLTSSLNYETTLAQVASLAVPDLADWCTVDMLADDKSIVRLGVAHAEHAKVQWASELNQRYPLNLDDERGVPAVIRTGKSELYTEIPDELLVASARDEEHLRLVREIGLTSAMVVPLSLRNKTFGAITFVTDASKRRYDANDLVFAEDLGRRAAIAIENARLYRDSQESSRLKDQFLANISHELRTPLTAVLGWAHMLRAGQLDTRSATHALETIERNARSQAQLIDDLLDVSRIITGKLRLDVTRVEPGSFIESAIEALRPAAEAKDVRVQRVIDTGVASVAGDPARLQQVVWNLLSNAIKFTPKGGRVQVRLERVDSHLEIGVSDTGIGIKPEFLPHVFERFRQADQTTTRQYGGLGLGLAIVRQLVELHGGTVGADSAGEGKGATFTVRLPVVPIYQNETQGEHVHPTARETLPSYDCPERLDGLKVLVVDDEPDTRDLLKFGLSQCGAHVTVAGSTQEAMEAIEKERPELLISDIGMPMEDGYGLIRRVRALSVEAGGRVPAIALTAYARTEDRLKALRSGYHMHVPKPVELSELVAVAASLIQRS